MYKLLYIMLIIISLPLVSADIITVNSGGGEQVCLNEGFDCFFIEGNVTEITEPTQDITGDVTRDGFLLEKDINFSLLFFLILIATMLILLMFVEKKKKYIKQAMYKIKSNS